MDLQLSDSNFRRHILLQYLILFQYLKGQVKFKRQGVCAPALLSSELDIRLKVLAVFVLQLQLCSQ